MARIAAIIRGTGTIAARAGRRADGVASAIGDGRALLQSRRTRGDVTLGSGRRSHVRSSPDVVVRSGGTEWERHIRLQLSSNDSATRQLRWWAIGVACFAVVAGVAFGLSRTSASGPEEQNDRGGAAPVEGPDHAEPGQRDGPDRDEALWARSFDDGPWTEHVDVTVVGQNNATVLERGPHGRSDVLAVSFGEDGSRWGLDARHSFADLGLEPREEISFSYDVYFPADFEFVGDGKMGGLAGVGEGLDQFDTSSGGNYDERSFSVRAMWKQDRGVVMYLYARHAAGRDFTDPANYGYGIAEPFVKADGSESDVLTPDTWHRIEQRVRMNTPGRNDGVYELLVDGHRGVSVTDVQYRTADHPDLKINQLFSAWFFGGGPDQFPSRRNVVYTDDWVLESTR